MHIYEGILAASDSGRAVLLGGAVLSAAGTAVGLWRIDQRRIPRTAMLSAAFFVASTVHVPVGPTSEHLVLGGLLGLVLGWAAFPAVLVALMLQAMFFSFGGPVSLGVNTLVMAAPAVACHYLLRSTVRSRHPAVVFAGGAAAGVLALLLGGTLAATALMIAGGGLEPFAAVMLLGHLPLAVVEGLVTGSVVVLLRRVRPDLLDAEPLPMPLTEMSHG